MLAVCERGNGWNQPAKGNFEEEVPADPHDHQHALAHHRAAPPNLLIPSVDDQLRILLIERPSPPRGDLRIQLLRQRRYLALAHLQTAQSLGDRAYLARRHALHIHLQHRQNQGLLAALVALEQLGLKLPVAVLRNRQLQLAHPRLQRPRLVPVAPASPIPGALVAASAKKTRHLRFQNLLHRALYQPAKKILPAQPVLPSLHNLNTLSLASHLRRPPWECRLLNNILRNRPKWLANSLPTQQLLQKFTDSILFFGSFVWLGLQRQIPLFNSRIFYWISRLSFGMYLNHEYMYP